MNSYSNDELINYLMNSTTEDEKYICRDCVGNVHLKEYIKKHGVMFKCSYCGNKRKTVTLENLLEDKILDGIYFAYDEADNCLGRCDGEYTSQTFDTYDLIHDELAGELNFQNDNIADDICDLMEDKTWCHADPYGETQDERDLYTWQSFCDLVMHRIRYLFSKGKNIYPNYYMSNPENILEIIAEYAKDVNLINTYNPTSKTYGKVYRGRMHDADQLPDKANDFGPPPYEIAAANRMSAEGIPIFYAAYDEQTVLSEIYDTQKEYATIASFNLNRPLTLLNLDRLKSIKIPSIFDDENRKKGSAIKFLKEFAHYISRSINETPAIKYVPTQIVTEYFRYVFVTSDKQKLDGIIYSSAQNDGGRCVALFMDPNMFNSDESMVDKKTMTLTRYKKKLDIVSKNKPCKFNNHQNFANTKTPAKESNVDERPRASCDIMQ